MKEIMNIAYGPHAQQRMDLHLPETEACPLFIYLHGGGMESGDKSKETFLGAALTAAGVAFLNANYRMYPEAKYPDFVEDAAAVVAWAFAHQAEYGWTGRIYVGGSSAGGYLSMMLCFDEKYLGKHGIKVNDVAGFFHDAGQPTTHFNVLRERGVDTCRVIVDEAAPLYHIGLAESYPPMQFIVSDEDMENRFEQTQLVLSTLRHFRYDESKYACRVMHGRHCKYIRRMDESGKSEFAQMILDFLCACKAI